MTLLQIGVKVKDLLTNWGFSENFSAGMRDITDFIIVLAIVILTYFVLKYVVIGLARRIARRSSTTWDDADRKSVV